MYIVKFKIKKKYIYNYTDENYYVYVFTNARIILIKTTIRVFMCIMTKNND